MRQKLAATAIALSAFSLSGCLLLGSGDGGENSEVKSVDSAPEKSDIPDVEGNEGDRQEEPNGENGTRDNPYPLGETVSYGDWEASINSVDYDVAQSIADENMFNDPAPEGMQFILVNSSVTYTGNESERVMMGARFAYVSDSGETYKSSDSLVVTPDALDLAAELYAGGTESGNVAIAVPEDGAGLVRLTIGIFGSEDIFFLAE